MEPFDSRGRNHCWLRPLQIRTGVLHPCNPFKLSAVHTSLYCCRCKSPLMTFSLSHFPLFITFPDTAFLRVFFPLPPTLHPALNARHCCSVLLCIAQDYSRNFGKPHSAPCSRELERLPLQWHRHLLRLMAHKPRRRETRVS